MSFYDLNDENLSRSHEWQSVPEKSIHSRYVPTTYICFVI